MLYSQDSAIGKEVDGFHVLDVLGRGGMGVVYKAEDVALARMVALKMIDPSLAHDEAFLRRFREEARALARIDSPYIVKVHALRKTDIGLGIVMEFVDGGTVYDLRIPMPWQRAAPLIKQMLTALEHAHSVGVIHRDIKPRNIMLTKSGTVKVTDFGLAKLNQGEKQATVTQGIAGTLYYMSPEQVKGLATLDHRSDLYSLGMTLYEMLAGRVPFDKEASEFTTMRMIVEEKLPSPNQFNKDIPAPLVKIIMRSLEKDPDKRYQSAAEMLAALEALGTAPAAGKTASGDETVAQHPPFAPPGSRKRGRLAAVAAGLVLLLATAGYVLYSQIGGGPEDVPIRTELPLGDDPAGQQVSSSDGDQDDEQTGTNATPASVAAQDGPSNVSANPGSGAVQRPAAPATLILQAVGQGTIQVNDRPATGSTSVPAGRHEVTCGDGDSRSITLAAGETQELTCYFEESVNIGATAWGTLYVNGENTGVGVPVAAYPVGPGTHRIGVRRDGWPTPEEQTIIVTPGFAPMERRLSFEMQPP